MFGRASQVDLFAVDLLEVDLLEVELLNESRWSFGCQLKKSFFNERITKIL